MTDKNARATGAKRITYPAIMRADGIIEFPVGLIELLKLKEWDYFRVTLLDDKEGVRLTKIVNITLEIPEWLLKRVKIHAIEEGIPYKQWIEQNLEDMCHKIIEEVEKEKGGEEAEEGIDDEGLEEEDWESAQPNQAIPHQSIPAKGKKPKKPKKGKKKKTL